MNKLKNENKIKELRTYYLNMINSTITDLLNKNEKLIIEGIQLFLYSSPIKLKPHSIIILGTSSVVSFYRAYLRNKSEDWSKDWNKLDIIKDIYYNLFIVHVEKFIKLVKSWKK